MLTSGISRRVRPVLRRRRQRDHQERRQHVLRQLPRQPDEPGLERRDAVRGRERRRPHTSTINDDLRGHLRRADRQGSAVVLRAPGACRASDAQTSARIRPGMPYSRTDDNKRGEIKLTGHRDREPHDSGRVSEQPPGARTPTVASTSRSIPRTLDNATQPNWYTFAELSRRVRQQLPRRGAVLASGRFAFDGVGGTSTAHRRFAVHHAHAGSRALQRAAISTRPIRNSATTAS